MNKQEGIRHPEGEFHFTIKDWLDIKRDTGIVWSIYCRDENGKKLYHEGEKLYSQTLLDLQAPEGCPDGEHPLIIAAPCHNANHPNVEVRNGHFVPRTTAEALASALTITHDDGSTSLRSHHFVEEWHWLKEQQALAVGLGS